MRKRVSQATFELIVNNASASFFDKTYRSNPNVIPGYQYLIKEFDFIQWIDTGRWAKAETIKIFNNEQFLNDSGFTLPKKYLFFDFVIVELYL